MMKIVPPPASALAVTSGNVFNGTNFQTVWTGGVGPFAQQRKISLAEPTWLNENLTSGNSATVRTRGASSGFFREVDTAGQTSSPADRGSERSHGAARQRHYGIGLRNLEPVRKHADV